MYDKRTEEINRTILSLDIILSAVAFIFAFWCKNFFQVAEETDFYSHLFLFPLILALLITFLTYSGAYKSLRHMTIYSCSWSVFRGLALTVGVLLSLLFFLEIEYISRLAIMIFAVLEFFALLSIRAVARYYFLQSVKSGENKLLVMIIGTGERAKELADTLRKQVEWGLEVVGYLDPDPVRVGQVINNVRVIGTTADISKCLKKHVVDEVIIAIPRSFLDDAEPIVQACEEEGIKLRFMADLFSLQLARISLTQVGRIPLLTMEPVAHDDSMLFAKRIFDLIVTTLSLPFFLPLLAIIAVAVKIDSPGPIFFVQQRVGLRKHLLPMIKFRSMFVDAEERLKEVEHLNEAEGPIFKIKNDPRVTMVGKFIRKTSLDELPQLFNVLRGEMSLVGPRPMSIRDVDLFDKGIQRKRFSVKPGITCIWQTSGRSDLPFTEWLKLDLEYIDNWSLLLDLKILLKTIPVVLKSKGAV